MGPSQGSPVLHSSVQCSFDRLRTLVIMVIICLSFQFTLLLRGTVNFRVYIPITIGSVPSQPGRKSSTKTPSPTVTFMGFPSTSLQDQTDGITPYPNEGKQPVLIILPHHDKTRAENEVEWRLIAISVFHGSNPSSHL